MNSHAFSLNIYIHIAGETHVQAPKLCSGLLLLIPRTRMNAKELKATKGFYQISCSVL